MLWCARHFMSEDLVHPCSLLQFYGLGLHNLTPSEILHIVAFITLCEAYMGIKPHFNLWNYFFRVQLRSDTNTEVAMLGCVDVYVRFGQGANTYFHLSVSNPPVRVAERVTLPMERCHRVAPRGYR
jgi:hypothetical protein